MERLFETESKDSEPSDQFGRIIYASDRLDFHLQVANECIRSFQESREMPYTGDQARLMAEGRLLKIPSGVPSYEDQIALARQVSDNGVVLVHGHGNLWDSALEFLLKEPNITLPRSEWGLSPEVASEVLARRISERIVREERDSAVSISQDKMVRMNFSMGHCQCGGEGLNFESALTTLILNSNRALYDDRPEAGKLKHFIDLRGGLLIGVEKDEHKKLVLTSFTREELTDCLTKQGLEIGYETQCVDDNFPYASALEEGLAEKAWSLNRTTNHSLADAERTRENSYVHNVGILFVGTPKDAQFAAFLQNCTQVLRNMTPCWGRQEQLANASASLIYLMEPHILRKIAANLSGIYELVGPGHQSTRMKRESGVNIEANPLYHQRYPTLRGVAVGRGTKLRDTALVRIKDSKFRNIPRGPAVMFSQSAVEALGGWKETLQTIRNDNFLYSTVMCVDPSAGPDKQIVHSYDSTHEDIKPISPFGWRNLSG